MEKIIDKLLKDNEKIEELVDKAAKELYIALFGALEDKEEE